MGVYPVAKDFHRIQKTRVSPFKGGPSQMRLEAKIQREVLFRLLAFR